MKANNYIVYSLILLSLILISCQDTNTKTSSKALAASSGRINHLSVIIDNDLWKGDLGEAVREHLAAPVDGLPQEEPMFTMAQMPPEAFSSFARKNRTFLKFEKSAESGFEVVDGKFANPQIGVIIRANDSQQAKAVFVRNKDSIRDVFRNTEIKEKQKRIRKSLKRLPELEKQLHISVKIPTAYRIAKNENDYLWIRKDITNGSMNLSFTEIPYGLLKKDTNVIGQIIKIRDSIGGDAIQTDEGGRFITEEAYAPYLFQTEIDGRPAYEVKGTWEVKNKFMAGPFISYLIENPERDRYLMVEGFTFAPSVDKRNYMFELEAIIRSLRFLE